MLLLRWGKKLAAGGRPWSRIKNTGLSGKAPNHSIVGMKSLIIGLFLAVAHTLAGAEVLSGIPEIVFASEERGRQALTNRDQFVQRLSPFDRAARLKTDQPVSEPDFLRFVGSNVLAFSDKDKANVSEAIQKLKPLLQPYRLNWPASILMIKTTGKEEGNAAYTRENAIILPAGKFGLNRSKQLERVLCHELFHILSRHDPALKNALYETIGFQECAELKLPKSWAWLTNPDAPVNDHWIRLKRNGKSLAAVPILLATPPKYDLKKGGEFFDYRSFKLLEVKVAADGAKSATFDPSNPTLLDPGEVEGFFEQVGQNTDYIIHPEEILAENFVLLTCGGEGVINPRIIAKMKKALQESARR